MEGNNFFILDVFAEERHTGNQLAVVMVRQGIPDFEMQQIAREFNYSETTFILSGTLENGGYNVRIFTPKEEVPFAGHPTLGTAYVIQKEIIRDHVEKIILNLKAGQIPVQFVYEDAELDRLVMKQLEPVFGKLHNKDFIADVLSIDLSDIDERFPVEEVSTGLPFIIVPLKTLDAVKRAKINGEKYFRFVKNTDAKAILIFSSETYRKENHLNVRMFADYYGISEDPATGSANGCLAGYLVKHRYWEEDHINVRVEQGYEIGRPSLLFLEAKGNGEKIDIYVGGRVIAVAGGVCCNVLEKNHEMLQKDRPLRQLG